MLRLLALGAGLASGVTLSQFPEFSQQYLQRLGGQADSLAAVVAEFDASAQKAGLAREAALSELRGSTFLDLRQNDMRRVIARSERASADYALLKAAGPLERLALPHRFRDGQTLAATWADFRPAIPVTFDGLIAAGIGYALGWGLFLALAALARRPFRRLA
jgi:hypothetical protein